MVFVTMTDRLSANVRLVPLAFQDRDQFIRDNQESFKFGALEEFGRRDDHFEEDGEIISRETIEKAIDGGEAYRIMLDDEKVGGLVIRTNEASSNCFLSRQTRIIKG